MIVGIIGKIDHGKDTVAKHIIRNAQTLFTERRFADPVKACIAEILNCTTLELNDNHFKARPLEDEWTKHKVTYMDGGQSEYFGSFEEADNHVNSLWLVQEQYEITEEIMTPRTMLQTLGTEWGRKMIHPDIWVNSMMHLYEHSRVNGANTKYPDWIMPDVRFPNEAEAIKERDGILIKVIRPGVDTGTHESEMLVDTLPADHIIINDSSLSTLEEKTHKLIMELGL